MVVFIWFFEGNIYIMRYFGMGDVCGVLIGWYVIVEILYMWNEVYFLLGIIMF